jgi:hypothetical protein
MIHFWRQGSAFDEWFTLLVVFLIITLFVSAILRQKIYFGSKNVSVAEVASPKNVATPEWKLIIKNGETMLEASGMDAESVNKILSWKQNINPQNREKKSSQTS